MKHRFDTLVEAVLFHAETSGDKPAVILKDEVLTYGELALLARRIAFLFHERYGIKAGDRVMISGVSRPEYPAVLLGLQYLHAVTVPLDKLWPEEAVLRLYDFVRPRMMVTDMEIRREDVAAVTFRALDPAAAPEADPGERFPYVLPDPDRVAEMLFTTGTTGAPKGAMLTYRNIRAITLNNMEGVGIRPDDVVLNPLPLCHSLGLREVRMALYAGATLVLQNGFSAPGELRGNIDRFHCTGFVCVPAVLERLTRSEEGFEQLFGRFRFMEIGAGSLSMNLRKRLPAMLPDTEIFNTWGSSETGGVIFLDVKRRQDKIASLGKPVSSSRVKVVGPSGEEIRAPGPENPGRLALSGEMVMAGYYSMPEENRSALADGWFLTSDLVYTDGDGFVYMLGRVDDIINVGGEKVSPIEVERFAGEYEKIRDAACIGVPDEILGQIPVLFVQAEDPFDTEELMDFLREKLGKHKRPREIVRIGELPRNRMEKLDRKALRKLWDNRRPG